MSAVHCNEENPPVGECQSDGTAFSTGCGGETDQCESCSSVKVKQERERVTSDLFIYFKISTARTEES